MSSAGVLDSERLAEDVVDDLFREFLGSCDNAGLCAELAEGSKHNCNTQREKYGLKAWYLVSV